MTKFEIRINDEGSNDRTVGMAGAVDKGLERIWR
jgi:hypothetical protein